MNRDSNVVFEGSIPENYDRYLGPVFFEPSARDLIGRLSGKQLHSVLELACGTGILTRMLRDSLLPSTNIVATDLNPGMIAFAKNKFRSEENVEWKEADASALPFPDKSFDAVICQYGLMFVPEKDAAMREAYRVLKPGGAFLFNVWDAIDRNPTARTAHETISSFFESDPPTFYELPFNMHDVGLVRELLQKAGFKSIDSELVTLPCRSASANAFAIGLVRGNPVSTAIHERGVDEQKVINAVAREIGKRFGTAPVETTMQASVWRALRP